MTTNEFPHIFVDTNRDSVCAGDDMMSHKETTKIDEQTTKLQALEMQNSGYIINMLNTIWLISLSGRKNDQHHHQALGYIVTNSDATVEIILEGENNKIYNIIKDMTHLEIFCKYYCSSDFTIYKNNEIIYEYPDEMPFLEKIRKSISHWKQFKE